METTDYVSYKLAVKLKETGFDEPCEAFYLPPMKNRPEPFFSGRVKRSIKNETHAFHLSAPSLYHAQKWLREKKGFDIENRVWLVGVEREYRPYIMPPKCKDFIAYPPEKSYEQALSAGISAALELIKKGE